MGDGVHGSDERFDMSALAVPLTGGALRSAVSQAMVRLYATAYGKGATQVKTYAQDTLLVTVMRDVLTPAERTLIQAGREDEVRSLRDSFQQVMRPQFIARVEQLTGRRVEAFTSQIDPRGDVVVEAFVLDQPVNA
jgi:uncharacterized protein YbcI